MAKRMKNSGSVFYREDRKRWIFQVPPHLTHIRSTISAKTQKELNYKIEKFYKEIEEIKLAESNVSIVEICKELEETKLKKNLISEGTYGRNLYTISKIEESYIGKIPIKDVTLKDLNLYSTTLTSYSNSVINKIFIQLRKSFKYAVDNDWVPKNLMDNIDKPKSIKEDKKVYAFTLEEQKEFLLLMKQSIYYMQYLIALNTGMRIGEINALHISDINFRTKKININKTVSRDQVYNDFIKSTTKTKAGIREVPINEILYSELKNYCKNKKGYLFSEYRVISSGMVNSEIKRLCSNSDKIKTKVSTHVLRHTFATRCIESGMPAVVLSKILGHTDISTTLNTYTDVFNEFKQEHFEIATEYFKKLY